MILGDDLFELFGNYSNLTHNNQSGRSKGGLLDECGFVRSLRFTGESRAFAWITRISFPMFLTIGTIGNVLALVRVWKEKKGPKRTFIFGICFTDLWFLWNRLIIQIGAKTWETERYGLDNMYGKFYQKTAGAWLYLESVLFFASQWILIAFCMDRFLAVRFPLHHLTSFRRKSLLAVAFIFVFSALNALYIPVVYYWIMTNNLLKFGEIIPQFPRLFRHWRRIEMWWEVLERLVAYIVTATLNMLIIIRLRQSSASPAESKSRLSPADLSGDYPLTALDHHPAVRRSNSSNSANRILITSSFFFLITNSLDFGITLLLAVSQAPICLFQITNGFLQMYDPFRWFLLNTYFSCGFTFYLCSGDNSFSIKNFRWRLLNGYNIPLTERANFIPTARY